MADLQEQYDDAMLDFTRGDYGLAIAQFQKILDQAPEHFEARLALAVAFYRQGDYASAISEGHKAEKLKPHDQHVQTNLSLFYMRAGDKKTAEHYGLQARIASWKQNPGSPTQPADPPNSELEMAKPKMEPVKIATKFPDMPWKKKPPADGNPGPA